MSKPPTGETQVRLRGLSRVHAALSRVLRGPLRDLARLVYRPLARRLHVTMVLDGAPVRFLFGSEPPTEGAGITPPDLRRFATMIAPGQTVADVGAHVGTFSVIAAARVGPAGRVFSFEPTPASRLILERNLALNHFGGRVTVVPAAVSDRSGTTVFYVDGRSTTNSLMLLQPADPAGTAPHEAIEVQLTTLDDYFATVGRDPDMIKIDVEGAEFGVLRGADRILRGPTRVLCELHPYAWTPAGHDGEQLVEWLRARGRQIVSIHTGEVLHDFQYGVTELVRTP